jgi:hypothetical protein
MVEQSLSEPGKIGWYEKENKNVRNLKVHTEKLLHGSMPNLTTQQLSQQWEFGTKAIK